MKKKDDLLISRYQLQENGSESVPSAIALPTKLYSISYLVS